MIIRIIKWKQKQTESSSSSTSGSGSETEEKSKIKKVKITILQFVRTCKSFNWCLKNRFYKKKNIYIYILYSVTMAEVKTKTRRIEYKSERRRKKVSSCSHQ